MGAKGDKERIKDGDIYNIMEPMYKKGMGTLAYRDSWNLFDQILTTGNMVETKKEYKSYKIYKSDIFSPDYTVTPEGQYKGYPFRMYGGDTYYANGYSDHFAVYTVLLREAK